MDLRHLRTFVTVAEAGTVSRAAALLHVAQPALSRQVMALEQELGVALFDRVAGRLQITRSGEQLLASCRGLLSYAHELREQARAMQRPDAGVLRVAASPHYIDSIFPEFLRRFAQRFPAVRVALVDSVGPVGIGMLERGEIDVMQGTARMVQPEQAHIATVALHPVDMLAAWRPGLALGEGPTLDITRLAPYPLLQTGSEYVIRRTFDAACRFAGFEPNTALESRAPHALLAMAEAGHGVAIIPSALRTHRYRLRIARVAYRRKVVSEPLALLYDRRRPHREYVRAFCEMLPAYVDEVYPQLQPSHAKKVK